MHCSFLLLPLAALLNDCLAVPTSLSTLQLKREGIADCSGGTYSDAYSDGQGTYVNSDTITHPYKSPRARKCWQDYMAVSSSIW